MNIHLMDQQTAESMSRRFEASPFILGLIGAGYLYDLALWLATKWYGRASAWDLADRGLMLIAVFAILVVIIQYSRKAIFIIPEMIACCALVAERALSVYTRKNIGWFDITLFVVVGVFLIAFLAAVLNRRFSKNKLNSGPA